MPLVRISLLKGKSNDQIRAIADSVHQALMETFEVPADDRFQFVDQYEPEEFIYDPSYMGIQRSKDVVFINITLAIGETQQPSSGFTNGWPSCFRQTRDCDLKMSR